MSHTRVCTPISTAEPTLDETRGRSSYIAQQMNDKEKQPQAHDLARRTQRQRQKRPGPDRPRVYE